MRTALAALALAAAAVAAEPRLTTIRITDRVLVEDTQRFGINLGGDAYYSGAALVKKRARHNFEGTSYRQCHFGPMNDARGATSWFGDWGSWNEILVGGSYTILSGPARGTTGTIQAIETRRVEHRGELKEFRYFVYDREVPPAEPNMGLLVETFRLREGQLRDLDGYWCSRGNRIAVGDAPPGSFGCAAACLRALPEGQEPAWTLAPDDVTHWVALCRGLAAAGAAAKPSIGKRAWDRLEPELRQAVARAGERRVVPETLERRLLEALNAIIRGPSLHDREAVEGARLPREARRLIQAERSPAQERQLDRLLLEAALPRAIGGVPGERAHLRFATHYQRYGQTNGTWHLRFWARGAEGEPRLRVTCDREEWGSEKTVPLTPQWKHHHVTLVADKVPEPQEPRDNPHLLFRFEVAGGSVLLDDVETWMEGEANPTAFRDDCVAMLRRYRPGVVRYLQMGGSTARNTILPPLRSHAYTSRNGDDATPYARHRRDPYGLHQLYRLCERLGCEPWYCLPGTLHAEEIERFMEYLGAPPEVGLGALRAELGHPRPWTEVFDHIHVEFGNEAWNNAGPYQCGGFNGRDYWEGLIARAKASPHYKPTIVFHAGGQAANPWLNRAIIERVPNADCFSLAPYILHHFSREQARALDTDAKLFRWVFAFPIWRSRHEDGAMFRNHQLARKAGMELSVYEVNHHITGGDGPLEPRNRIVTSIGGGLNVANAMLLMLKDHGLRFQCLFALAQHSYNARGVGPVRLWGTALCMRQGRERYRPTFLAAAAANRVLGGDLVETTHTGAHPTFDATGVFQRRKPPQTIEDLPVLWSYAFRDGRRRGLILVSLDTAQRHPVAIEFDGGVEGATATCWELTADRITANNEYEVGEPQVELREQTLEDFRSGIRFPMPPFAMRVLAWQAER
ncbi:MAG: hypothetical protein ACLF0G_18155 [Candidatus Brocadiia bacterium]